MYFVFFSSSYFLGAEVDIDGANVQLSMHKAFGFLTWSSLCFPFHPPFTHWRHRLDRRIVVDMHMSVLFVRYGDS